MNLVPSGTRAKRSVQCHTSVVLELGRVLRQSGTEAVPQEDHNHAQEREKETLLLFCAIDGGRCAGTKSQCLSFCTHSSQEGRVQMAYTNGLG